MYIYRRKMITVEETLKSADLPSDVIPHLIWKEVLLGAQKRRVFLEGATITNQLQGDMGTKISVPYLSTKFTAATISESSLDSSGYTVSDLAVSDTDISVGNQVYVAFRLSYVLREDQPRYDWVQLAIRDAGRAVAVYEDAAVRDVLLAGAGNSQAAGTAGTLTYDDIINTLSLMKADGWFPDDIKPLLYIHPDQEADLLKDTTYVSATTNRYAVGSLPELPGANYMTQADTETIYAGCRVRVTDNMTKALALIVFPEHPQFGPTYIHAIKRPLTVRTDDEVLYGRQLWTVSTRYGTAVMSGNADGVGLITNC